MLLWTAGEELLWRGLARRTFLLATELKGPVNPFQKGTAKTPPPQLILGQLLSLANFLHRKDAWGGGDGWGGGSYGASALSTLFSEASDDDEGEDTFTMDDIEGTILDLLDQGMLKGYVARQQKVVVLKREGHGFVPVEEARRWKAANAVNGNGGGEGEAGSEEREGFQRANNL